MNSLVVVPTYNERETVTALLDALEVAAPTVQILMVDDASPDGTADAIRAHHRFGAAVFLLERPAKNGIGGAYREGFAWALARGYDRIAQMDADLSHPASSLPLPGIDVLASTSNGYCFQIENTWRAKRRGLRVAEVPIVFTDRTAGASKMSFSIVREALGRVLVWRAREILTACARPGTSPSRGRGATGSRSGNHAGAGSSADRSRV